LRHLLTTRTLARRPVTIFSDFSCPYSYLAESSVRRVVAEGEVVYRAFELFPEPTRLDAGSGFEEEGWEAVRSLAREEGIDLSVPGFRPRTRKAHEAARHARTLGMEPRLRAGIFSAYWKEKRDIGRIDVLTDIAALLGMDPEALKIALDIDSFSDDVAADIAVAKRLGVPGTPTLFLGLGRDARVVAGAYPAGEMRRLLEDDPQ